MRFLFVDRILQLSPGEIVRGIKHVTRDDTYLYWDENGRACFVSSLIGETLGQLAAWNVMFTNEFTLRPVAGVCSSARLHRPVYVGETLLLESVIESLDNKAVQYHSVAYVGDEIVFTIEGALGPLLPMTDFIDEDVVRRQFMEINRPGDWPQRQAAAIDSELTTDVIAQFCRPYSACPRSPVALKHKGEGKQLPTDMLVWPGTSMSFDRILASEPGVSITAEKCVTRTAPYFADHFPNKPVLPMTVLLECKMNLAREFVARASFNQSYQVRELRRIKMNEFVHPGEVLVCHLKVKEQNAQRLVLNYRSEVDGKRVCILDVVMTAKGIKYEE